MWTLMALNWGHIWSSNVRKPMNSISQRYSLKKDSWIFVLVCVSFEFSVQSLVTNELSNLSTIEFQVSILISIQENIFLNLYRNITFTNQPKISILHSGLSFFFLYMKNMLLLTNVFWYWKYTYCNNFFLLFCE